MRKKLKDTGGFTLVEMLCAAIILVLLSLMMSTGLSLAAKSYRDITAESEIRLLRNSLTDVLTDRLRYAVVTELDPGRATPPQKWNCDFGARINTDGSMPDVDIDDHGMLTVDGQSILSDGVYGEKNFNGDGGRRYEVEKVSGVPFIKYNGDNNSFTINFVVKDTRTNISQETKLTIPCLNPLKKEV